MLFSSFFQKKKSVDNNWTKIKCNRGPGELYGHSAIKAFNCMFIFGGERNGNLLQELWRFNFGKFFIKFSPINWF